MLFMKYNVISLILAAKSYKTDLLISITDETKGIFGELYGGLLNNSVRLLGMFSRLDDQKESGILHLGADAPDLIPVIAAHATYDKIGIEQMEDVFTLDNRSVARVGLGYKIKPYLIFYMDYIWTFVEAEPNSHQYITAGAGGTQNCLFIQILMMNIRGFFKSTAGERDFPAVFFSQQTFMGFPFSSNMLFM